jgi:hypothetical protein
MNASVNLFPCWSRQHDDRSGRLENPLRSVGVRVVQLGTAPAKRVWLVAETMAVGATSALDAPATVDRERNLP